MNNKILKINSDKIKAHNFALSNFTGKTKIEQHKKNNKSNHA